MFIKYSKVTMCVLLGRLEYVTTLRFDYSAHRRGTRERRGDEMLWEELAHNCEGIGRECERTEIEQLDIETEERNVPTI